MESELVPTSPFLRSYMDVYKVVRFISPARKLEFSVRDVNNWGVPLTSARDAVCGRDFSSVEEKFRRLRVRN